MAIQHSAQEREALERSARAILDDCPDVFRLIARGAAAGPEHDAIVYLRTAADSRRRRRRREISSGSYPPPGAGSGRTAWRPPTRSRASLPTQPRWRSPTGGDELCDRPPAQSSLQPRSHRFAAERRPGEDPVRPAARRARRIVREGRGPRRRGSNAQARDPDSARWPRRLRRRNPKPGLRLAGQFVRSRGAWEGCRPPADRRHHRRAQGCQAHQPQRDRFRRRLDAGVRPHARRPRSRRIASLACRRRVLRLPGGRSQPARR